MSGPARSLLTATLLLALILLLVMLVAISVGATRLSIRSVLEGEPAAATIFWELRLPRVCLAALAGAILALSGLTFQTMLRNPLADPFLLGISGGAGAASAIATSLGLARIPALIPIASFCGAMLATFAVLTLARRRGRLDSNRLILAGLVLNAFFSALILLAVSLAKASDLALAVRWMMGGFSAASWADVMLLGGSLVAGLAVLASIGGEIRMLEFGEEDARSKGVDPDRINTIAFVGASLMTGIAVSVSGIIGFIGLLVPHAIRSIWRRDYRFLIYLCAFGGAILLVAADAGARVVVAPSELPVGVLTALLGVPFFLVMLRRKES